MDVFAVYQNPSDYPGKFVVRKFVGENPDEKPLCVEDTLEEARKKIPAGLHRADRIPNDDVVIIETWF